MDLVSPEGGTSHPPTIHYSLNKQQEKGRIILIREDINHMGIEFPAFQKKVEDPSLPQEHTNHVLQPMRNHQSLKVLFFSREFLFKTTLPSFLLKPNKNKLLSFCSPDWPMVARAFLSRIEILYSQINQFCW